MTVSRYQELLGRLLEGELTADQAADFAQALETEPELLQDFRHHLVVWEVWSQTQAPERSPEAFITALRLRQRHEAEGADLFTQEVMARVSVNRSPFSQPSVSPAPGWQSSNLISHSGKTTRTHFLPLLRYFARFASSWTVLCSAVIAAVFGIVILTSKAGYEVFVSNEASGEVTIIDPNANLAVATIGVGKRPRAIHVSPDFKTVYIAVSGTPIAGPIDLGGDDLPVLRKYREAISPGQTRTDRSADGIAQLGVSKRKMLGRLPAGSDPEQFAFSRDGARIYLANEDASTAMVLNVASGRVEHTIPVQSEPEGVGLTPDGKVVYVTCETEGEVFAIDTANGRVITHFNVGGRPRSVDFLPDGSRAFIPSESTGQIHVIDSRRHKLLKTVDLPQGSKPMCIKVGPTGDKVYVSTGLGNTVIVMDSQTASVLKTIPVGSRPWGMAISPNGKRLYTANGLSDDVSVVDLSTEREVSRIKVGSLPWGVAVVPKTTLGNLLGSWPWGFGTRSTSSRTLEKSGALALGAVKRQLEEPF